MFLAGSPTLQHKRPSATTTASSEVRSSPNSSLGKLPTHSSSSVFAMVNSKGYTVSPENSLRRAHQQQQHHHHQMESSDLGSSIGDDSQRNVLVQALVSEEYLDYFFRLPHKFHCINCLALRPPKTLLYLIYLK